MSDSSLNLPPEIDGPSAWYGPELARSSEWIENLSSTEISEVERAAKRLASSSREIVTIRKQDFPLPALEKRLLRLVDDVLNGRGFVLLRGLPVATWTKRESAIAFFGIGTHIGAARPQNAKGHVLG